MSRYLLILVAAMAAWALLSFQPSSLGRRMGVGMDTVGPSYLRARDFKGRSITSNSGVVSLTSGFENDYYQVDSVRRSGDLYLEVKLAKLLNLPEKRTPLNICIVIDRSGSMQGIKMGYAKKAAKGIIDRLQPEDIVSVVMYDNSVDSVQSPTAAINKDKIKAAIDGIGPRGSTNLWGGTELGYQFVKRNYHSGEINRVLLISDGLANAGLTDSTQIRRNVQRYKDEEGITLSTFGVGLDYNETLMTDMAETGAGNYYFIDAPDVMVHQFDQELNGLMNAVALNARVDLDLPEGVSLTKGYPLRFSQSGRRVTLRLRDLFGQETRSTWFHFTIADGARNPLEFVTTLHYTDVLDGKEKELVNRNTLLPIKSMDAYLTHFNKPVIEQVVLFTVNENMELAMAEVDRGNVTAAKGYLDMNSGLVNANYRLGFDSASLRRLDSMNTNYRKNTYRLSTMSGDSLKRWQKQNRQLNYQFRSKKQ